MASSTVSAKPLTAKCHCGAVTIEVPSVPTEINECQCTICRRYAVAWAYYPPKDVKITKTKPTQTYVWGDCESEFHRCSHCGCITNWWRGEDFHMMGVNTRNMDPDEIRFVTRKIDFEILTEPLKSKDTAHPDDKAQY